MNGWTERRQIVFGWVFLILYTALGFWLNMPGDAGPQEVSEASDPSVIMMVVGWLGIAMFYVPAYASVPITLRKFGWTLTDWGFGLARISWATIAVAVLLTAHAWISAGGPREVLAAMGSGWPMGVFEGYARVAEELIYRGFALVFLAKTLPPGRGRKFLAVLIAGALFAVMHTQYDPQRRLSLFLGAALPLGAITLWTRSVSLAFVLHGLAGGGPVGALFGLGFFFVMAGIARRRSVPPPEAS